MSKKLIPGNVYAIPVSGGYGLIQYVGMGQNNIEVARVLTPIVAALADFTPEMCLQKERYYIRMVLRATERSGLIQLIGNYPLPPDAVLPTQYRSLEYVPHRNIREWYLVDATTWKRAFIPHPDAKFFALSSAGIWNAALLRERLEQDWHLENWR